MNFIQHIARMDTRRRLLWCAFIWYVVLMEQHASLAPAPWFNAVGIAFVVGLVLTANAVPLGGSWRNLGFWPLTRFFLIPFCVSSFSSAMRDVPLWIVFPRNVQDNLLAGSAVLGFLMIGYVAHRLTKSAQPSTPNLMVRSAAKSRHEPPSRSQQEKSEL